MATTKTYLGDGIDLYRDHHSVILKYGPMAVPLTRKVITELYARTADLQDTADAPTPSRTIPLMVVRPNRDDEMNEWTSKKSPLGGARPRRETSLEELI